MTREGGTECAGGLITDALGKVSERNRPAMQDVLCHGHAPLRQVLHRWKSNFAMESLREDRSRHPRTPSKRLDRPAPRYILVHALDGARKRRIGEA